MDVAIAPPPVVTQAPETLVVDNAYYMRPQHSATEACKAFGVDPEGFFATLHYGPVEDAANQFSAHVFMATAPQKPVAHFVFPPPRGSEHDYFGGYRCVLAHSEQLLWVSTDEFLLRVDYSTLSAPKILKIKFARMQDKDSSLMVWSHETKRLLCYNSDQPSMPFVYDLARKHRDDTLVDIQTQIRTKNAFLDAILTGRNMNGRDPDSGRLMSNLLEMERDGFMMRQKRRVAASARRQAKLRQYDEKARNEATLVASKVAAASSKAYNTLRRRYANML